MKRWKIYLVLGVIALMAIGVGRFYFERWLHYKVSYQAQVQGEIRELVKKECLK